MKHTLILFTIFLFASFSAMLAAAPKPAGAETAADTRQGATTSPALTAEPTRLAFDVAAEPAIGELSPEFCWFHPRAAAIPGAGKDGNPAVIMTLMKHLAADDHCSGLYFMRTQVVPQVAAADKSVLNVFLLAGQSNMAGADSEVAVPPGFQQTTADRATLFTTAPLPDGEQSQQYVPWGEVRGHESKGKLVHGPEVGFARTLHAAGWRDLAIIKVHANFGRDVQDWPWSERGSLFDDWTSFADARIAELVAKGHTIRVRGFLWHQGIDDAIHGKLASHCERNLSDLISVLRKRYADEHAPFVLARSVNSRIAQPDPNAGNDSPMAVVRRSQIKVGELFPFAAWIDVDDLPNVNTHHFSADSQLVIGIRFGEAFLKFQKNAGR